VRGLAFAGEEHVVLDEDDRVCHGREYLASAADSCGKLWWAILGLNF
jgi:hypothetical protein